MFQKRRGVEWFIKVWRFLHNLKLCVRDFLIFSFSFCPLVIIGSDREKITNIQVSFFRSKVKSTETNESIWVYFSDFFLDFRCSQI